jgi:hypothetical protein
MSLRDIKIKLARSLFIKDYLKQKLCFIIGLIESFNKLVIDFDVEYFCHIEEDLIPFLLKELNSQKFNANKDYS